MDWKQRALRHLDTLEPRISALNGKMYYGAGFHYAKHDEAKKIRRLLTEDPDPDPKLAMMHRIIAEVYLEGLTRDVIKAEMSARSWETAE